ncbi:MAG TPA: hypothetical protein VHN20_01960 [Beijerinckiaceae bacterium]|nr:hypothetical protein [Beijerinckiaceae bacterium]
MSLSRHSYRVLLSAHLLATTAIVAVHAEPAPGTGGEDKALEIPGGDIFGFTSPTDVGSPGDRGIAFELSSRAGKREGSYVSPTLKTQFGYTLAENLAVAFSPWITAHRIRGVPDIDDRTRVDFDGVSGEISYRFVERTATNPFAATLSTEPRFARVDALTGERVSAYGNEFKLFMDTVIVPDRLYGAVNLNYAFATQKGSDDKWADGSGTNVSGALTYQLTEKVFAGLEGRYLTAFSGAFLNHLSGQAVFAGPTLLVKLSDSAALNFVWTPQVAGRAEDTRGALDLDNFERHQFRAKLSASF